MASLTPRLSSSSSTSSMLYDDYNKAGLKLTNLIRDVNSRWNDPERRRYLLFKNGGIEDTRRYEKSSSEADLDLGLHQFMTRLSRGVDRKLSFELKIYKFNLAYMEFPIKEGVSKITETAKQAGIQPSKCNSKGHTVRFASISSTSEVQRACGTSFLHLTHCPIISIEDLTSAFQRAIIDSLQIAYYQDHQKHYHRHCQNSVQNREEAHLQNIIEKVKRDSEQMRYYLSGAFHQFLSEVTNLIDQDTVLKDLSRVDTKEKAYDQFLGKFDEILKIYQVYQETNEGMILPLGALAKTSLQNLIRKEDTTNALKIYFQQILAEKAKARV